MLGRDVVRFASVEERRRRAEVRHGQQAPLPLPLAWQILPHPPVKSVGEDSGDGGDERKDDVGSKIHVQGPYGWPV